MPHTSQMMAIIRARRLMRFARRLLSRWGISDVADALGQLDKRLKEIAKIHTPIVRMTWPMSCRGCCTVDGREIRFAAQEQSVFEALLLWPPDRWRNDWELIEAIYPDAEREPETARAMVRVYVASIRNKGVPVECLHGWGYQIPKENRAP